MAAITLAETKACLRVDNTVEDDLITKLIGSATATVENVLRQPLSAFGPLPDNIHTAILYTIAYLYLPARRNFNCRNKIIALVKLPISAN